MVLSSEIFRALQHKLKVGNRRGVHLNAIPANSRYKFDIARLSAIFKSLPERLVLDMLTLRNVKFSFSIYDTESTNIDQRGAATTPKTADENPELQKLVTHIETLIFQNEVVSAEKGINTLGFGFPILLRRDKSDGQLTAAPILIWSVKMKPTTQMNTWEISRNEDDPIYLNEVLINHLQSDSGVKLSPIPDEMLEDGKIDKPELLAICTEILQQLKIEQNLDFLLNNYAEIPPLKTKAEYEALLPNKGEGMIEKCGILSLFEVQKQNIINDYDGLISNFKAEEITPTTDFQTLTSVPTDPSQQYVLEQLRQQRKVLIQGPPGTGKSQTLTAILINALQNKQKTLVVCEKQTALEVLYNALQQKGLGKYCTMVKDAIADRKLIVEAVRQTLDAPDFKKASADNPSQVLTEQLQALQNHKAAINAIHHKLNQPLIAGQNWTYIAAKLLEYAPDCEAIDLSGVHFQFTDEEWAALKALWQEGERLYEDYRPYAKTDFLAPDTLTAQNFFSTEQQLATAFKQYEQQWEAICQTAIAYRQQYEAKRKAAFAAQLATLEQHRTEYEVLTATLAPTSDVFMPQKTEGFFYRLAAVFSSAKKKAIHTQQRLQQLSQEIKALSVHRNFSPIAISADLWANKAAIADYSSAIAQAQADFADKVAADFAALDLLHYADPALSDESLPLLQQQVQALKSAIQRDGWLQAPQWGTTYADFAAFMQQTLGIYKQYMSDPAHPLKATYQWLSWYRTLSPLQQQCVAALRPVKAWEASLLTVYYPLLQQQHADESLNFSAHTYSHFTAEMERFGATQHAFIQYYWDAEQRRTVKAFEEQHSALTVANLYNKRKSEKHNRLTLRQIAQQDIDLFTSFFPIVLTTPDACCNLFEGKHFYFDNVVFDEASQLKLEDNLPAMLKGKTIVIAGDEHQMPPSNYFSKVFDGTAEDEEDEDESDTSPAVLSGKEAMLNIESLLDYALEYQFSKNHLDFHYRSRHPYLIDFSNHAFYNARLRPLPNTKPFTPIAFAQVDGTFEEHINKEEAVEVIRTLERLAPRGDGSYPSVGIATFNITQRNYIRKQLLLKQQNDPAFAQKLSALEQAGLFIKNLENIQGDERDIIILSVTYGRKKDGKFVQSFGPLNHSKGYKLLNVIITRAKEKIYVCNSIPEEVFSNYKEALATEGANNRRAVLYAYLAYCKSVSTGDEQARAEILSELDRYGHTHAQAATAGEEAWKTQTYLRLKAKHPDKKITPDYPFGGYTIDILLAPDAGKPIAIECMSKPLYEGELAYLEDLHKEKILRGAGYEYERIWAVN